MSLLNHPPITAPRTCTARTHELRQGTELVARDGSTTVVCEVGDDGPRIRLQLTNGTTGTYRRGRRWRVIAPPAAAAVPVLAV